MIVDGKFKYTNGELAKMIRDARIAKNDHDGDQSLRALYDDLGFIQILARHFSDVELARMEKSPDAVLWAEGPTAVEIVGRYTHLVVISREGQPEVRGFHDYDSAFRWYDAVGVQWSESYLTAVLKGPLV